MPEYRVRGTVASPEDSPAPEAHWEREVTAADSVAAMDDAKAAIQATVPADANVIVRDVVAL